jgi:hypothetical protein
MALLAFLGIGATATTAVDNVPRDVAAWEALWSEVLAGNVDDRGRIDFAGLAANPGALERVVAFVERVGPASRPDLFPDRDHTLAYYINAYNALAMYGIVRKGIPQSLGGFRKFTFFFWQTFVVGGRSISLYRLENDVIRPLGEARVHFALNCMVRGCPRLPRAAFTAEALESQLEAATREFINAERNVAVVADRREVRASEIFDFYTEDFIARAPTLIDYINLYLTNPIPTDFELRFIDYDWTVNVQPGAG